MRGLELSAPFGRTAGEKLLRAGRLGEAEETLVDEARAGGHARSLLAAGHLALMRNDLALAEQRLLEAVARDRRNRNAWRLLAETAYRRGDWVAAAGFQDKAGNKPVAAKLRSFADGRLYEIEGPATATLPFVRRDPLPILSARVDDGPEVSFLLDTGGAEVILDSAFAASAGVPIYGTERSFFAGGRSAPLAHGGVGSLALGDLTIRNLPVQILNLAGVGPAVGVDSLAGIIGTRLLYRFLATIDYPGQALLLRRKGAAVDPDGAFEVPFLMADDHFMLAEGQLNDGARMQLFVDSGLAGGAFACPPSTLRDAGIGRGSGPIERGLGGGGKVKAWPFEIAALSMGAARRENLQGIAEVFPRQLEWAYGFRIGGLISHGFLDAFAVTLDFDRMAIRLTRT
jgi:predicted aspartyl protease